MTLRQFAKLVGVSPTYVSQVETGNFVPPTVERVQRMAEILGEPADALIALSGRMPQDLLEVIRSQAVLLAKFLREAKRLKPEQLQQLIEQARRLSQENALSVR